MFFCADISMWFAVVSYSAGKSSSVGLWGSQSCMYSYTNIH